MTKDEIKKGLECCCNRDFKTACRNCSYITCPGCNDTLCKDALNLITEQEQEIEKLKAENKQLKTECALLDDELRIARQDTVDVLNKLKEKAISLPAIETYHVCNLVDEVIKEQLKK